MDLANKPLDITFETAVEKFRAQTAFCKREKDRFTRNNALESSMFYTSKIQEMQWQVVQLQEHFETTGDLLKLKREQLSVPVIADNECLREDQLELDISDVFYNPTTESKKLYFLRYVVCLPLQRAVLQEQKTELFRTCGVDKVENKRIFHYPRNDGKVCDSLKRGYLTVEMYAERKLKAPTIVGAQRVSLAPFLDEPSIKGMLSFGANGEWDISYALNIRRPQLQEEKDNFKMQQKNWICLALDSSNRLARRVSIATMQASPRHHHRRSKNNRNHHKHRHHHSDDIKVLEEKTAGLTIISSPNSPCSSSSSLDKSSPSESSDRITDLPGSEKKGLDNKNTTTKLKKSLQRRISGFF